MKMFALALCLVVSSAFAAEVKVLNIPAGHNQTAEASFGFNEQLGRVWVDVNVFDRYEEDSRFGESYRAKVEGLTYDAQTKTVNLDIEGQLVECAVLKQRGVLVFRHNYLKATGCAFKTKVVTVLYDDGFEIQKRKELHVFLVTK